MKQLLEKEILNVPDEEYESPRMEVIEVEVESPILQMSGEDSPVQDW